MKKVMIGDKKRKQKSTIVCSQRSPSSWTSMILNDEVSSNSVVKRVTKHFTVLINVPKEKQHIKNLLRNLQSGMAFCLWLVAVRKRIYGLSQTQNASMYHLLCKNNTIYDIPTTVFYRKLLTMNEPPRPKGRGIGAFGSPSCLDFGSYAKI